MVASLLFALLYTGTHAKLKQRGVSVVKELSDLKFELRPQDHVYSNSTDSLMHCDQQVKNLLRRDH